MNYLKSIIFLIALEFGILNLMPRICLSSYNFEILESEKPSIVSINYTNRFPQDNKQQDYKAEWKIKIKKNQDRIPSILESLKKSSLREKRKILEELYMIPDPRSIEPLFELFENEKSKNVKCGAVKALSQIISYDSKYKNDIIPFFKQSLDDKSVGVRLCIADRLIQSGEGDCTVDMLLKIFTKEDTTFEKSLEYWIKEEYDRPDLPYEKQLKLTKTYMKRRPEMALYLLVKLGNSDVVAALSSCLNNPDNWIQTEAKDALNKINMKSK